MGNEEPVFAIPNARVVRTDRIGRDGNTLRAIVEGEGGGRLKVMAFRSAETPLGLALEARGGPLHLAGTLRAEEWQGSTTACLIVDDAAALETPTPSGR